MQTMPGASHAVNGSEDGAAAAALAFDGIRMTYPDGTEAIAEATFSVAEGEIVAIVGPSGCGKSTLLKVASGLVDHTDGSVAVDRANLGYVFQDATLLPWRSVRRNVELLLELHGVPKAERRGVAQAAIDLVGLTGFEDHYPKRLSGGMKMRASLARALTRKPRVFLFDEPFGALDEITRERLNDELLSLFAAERFAGLFITHSIPEACFLASRVLVMSTRPGRIVEEFAVPYSYPRTPETRYEPAFAELNGRISTALRAAS
ncbi:MAG TPA: ABC transporter ATP-binding protein [Acidimicrobiales bacterium]|nr:ABC transporter ATP-binding protein [Acidimicrobiales bacterium]